MYHGSEISSNSAIASLTEMLHNSIIDPDLALQVCQAMMEPKRRELILMVALCHHDNLENIAASGFSCGNLHKECEYVHDVSRSAARPCRPVRERLANSANGD